MMAGNLFKTTCLKDINCSGTPLRYLSALLIQGRTRHPYCIYEKQPFSTVMGKQDNVNDFDIAGTQGASCSVQLRNVHCCTRYHALPTVRSSTLTGMFNIRDMPVRSAVLPGRDAVCTILRSPSHYVQMRYKSKKKQTGTEDAESDSDGDDILEEDDFDAPPKFKVMKIHVASMRADAIISHALDVARNKLEEMFLGSGLLLNGSKMLKKSIKMDTGDYVDLVVEKVDEQLKVKRVKVIKIYPEKTSKEKFMVKVRVWKAPFAIAKPDSSHKDF